MSAWDTYPEDYRSKEVQAILEAVRGGECAAVVGLSGSGKSNLLGFLAQRGGGTPPLVLVDCNRLAELNTTGLFRLARQALGDSSEAQDEVAALEGVVSRRLQDQPGLCLLFDRFDALAELGAGTIFSNLRALRDGHKYELTYVIATRRALKPHNELGELFFAHTLWLGPLSHSDSLWNVRRYAARKGLAWEESTAEQLTALSGGYPALLRAACEAFAAGCPLDLEALAAHPAVQKRIEEFWADEPDDKMLLHSGLAGLPLLAAGRPADQGKMPAPIPVNTSQLTAKEHLLWEYLCAHPNQVCEKDELIRAVWPEDRIFERGIRDDSLAQLMRRLREKVEPDPSKPRYIHTLPGRGYRLIQ
ncbi:MAG TPA: winged helix-turn-helix domain-containing protein [Anaerolineales bacterium]|nr:winged helix-turn-helix domain-containing protein [Anaerolineales bacterium]